MERPQRNDPCHCGSGKKYKKCHLHAEVEDEREHGRVTRGLKAADPRLIAEAMPLIEAKMKAQREEDRRLLEEYGVHINYVRPTLWQGRKVWAIGSRLYANRPPRETFHEFILWVLRTMFGEPWRAEQAAMPREKQHFVMRGFAELAEFKQRTVDPEVVKREGVVSAEMNGWVKYLVSFAWDVATLIHAADPPDGMIRRLRSRDQFQGARYEIAIAAIFARLDCTIRFLDEQEDLRSVKHVEFEATHRPTGQTIAVEAKSRHRGGVINQPGDPGDDPLHGDACGVRRLFTEALAKAPPDMPYLIFLDVNAPHTSEVEARWQSDVQTWMNRMPAPTEEGPAEYTALVVTNFSPQHDADEVSHGGTWLSTIPVFAAHPLEADMWPALWLALNTYGGVPPFTEEGLLD